MRFQVVRSAGEDSCSVASSAMVEQAITYARRAASRYEGSVYAVVDTDSGLVLARYWQCAGVMTVSNI